MQTSAFCSYTGVTPRRSTVRLTDAVTSRRWMSATPTRVRPGVLQMQAPSDVERSGACQFETGEAVIRHMWEVCQDGEFTLWAVHFTPSAVYYDTLYPEPFRGIAEITQHFSNMEKVFTSAMSFVLDEVAGGEEAVGIRWHLEVNGKTIPFSRGASMYSFERTEEGMKIKEAWDFPETPLKVAGIVLPLVKLATAVLGKMSGDKRKEEEEGELGRWDC